MKLHNLLQIKEDYKCVAICGGGGKSSLCLALAKEKQSAGGKAAITTTTHIGCVAAEGTALFLTEDRGALRSILNDGLIPIAGKGDGGKLCYGGDRQFNLLLQETDTVYVEADGSKMLPLKYPAAYEPVIPSACDAVLVVCGLSALGHPLIEVCQRLSIAKEAIPELGDIADENAVSELLFKGYGRFNPVYVLNQADGKKELEAAERISRMLTDKGAWKAAVISLKNMGLSKGKPF